METADKRVERTPSFHWAWIILILCFVNLFINYGIRLGYGVVLPEMIGALGLSRRQGGDILNAYLLVYISVAPFVGYLTDRFGARRIISLFGILLGLGTLLLGTANSFWEGCLFFALVGMGASAMWTPILTVVQRWFSVKRRGMVLGIISSGTGLGFAVTGSVFPLIVRQWSWRYCWYAMGVACLFMVIINALFLRSKPEDLGQHPWGGGPDGSVRSTDRGESATPGGCYREILGSFRFWIIGLSYASVAFALYSVTTYLVDYARHSLGLPYEEASLLASIHGIGQVLGMLTLPLLSDRIGRRLTLCIANVMISICIANILFSGTHQLWLFVSVFVFGIFYGVIFPMYGACGGDYFRKEMMGRVIGAWTPMYGLAAIGGHKFTGYLRDVSGSFSTPFFVAIFLALVAFVLMLFVKGSLPQDAA